MKKVAVLMDGGFAIQRLKRLGGKKAVTADEVYALAKKCVSASEELFRIYFYHCPPFSQSVRHPISGEEINFADTATGRAGKQLLRDLELKDYVAVRAGELSFDGWVMTREATDSLCQTPRQIAKDDFRADLKQKRVDMKIGLDVAWLSSKRVVDRIILVTVDSDFVPAMKFARREGVQVVLVPLGATNIKHDVRAHADEIRAIQYP